MYLLNLLLLFCTFSKCATSNSTEPDVYQGLLTPNCIEHYMRIFITKRVPPRNYHYYHEAIQHNMTYLYTESKDNVTKQLTSQQDTDIKFRIVGGKKTTIQYAPYTVLYGKLCGGTILAPEWVLTAAHCDENKEFVYAGSTYRSKAIPYKICAHFTHPFWFSPNKLHSHDWDYQLLLLEKPIPVTPSSMPIAIGTLADLQEGQMMTVTGWGFTKWKNSTMQEVLHRVKVPMIPREKCTNLRIRAYRITPRMFCAGFFNVTKDACQGDSGGPIVTNSKLVGSVSFGIGCALPDNPGVYANVIIARNWIRKITMLPL